MAKEYGSLAEIATTDFVVVFCENHLLIPVMFEEMRQDNPQMAEKAVEYEKKDAVLKYLVSEKGRAEFREKYSVLIEKFELVRAHYIGFLMMAKVKHEAAEELSKLDNVDAKFLMVEYMIKGSMLQRDHIRKGQDIYLPIEKEMEELVASGDAKKGLDLIVDKLLEKPDWFDKTIANLDQADAHFLRAMPCGFFPPLEQINAGAKIMASKEWTPQVSVRYWLKAIQVECPKKVAAQAGSG